MSLYTSALSYILNVSFALSDVLTPNDVPEFVYYMNDGVYGSFMGKLFGNIIATPSVHKVNNMHAPEHMNNICTSFLRFLNWMFCVFQMSLTLDEPVFSSSLWGPSCDPLDQVVEHCLLPELAVGDWLIFNNMGASGHEGPATLSDTDQPPVYYTISTDDW